MPHLVPRPQEAGSCGWSAHRAMSCALAVSMLFPGCAALHPIRGIPASHTPPELLGDSREGQRTINLGLLVQPKPTEYRVAAGDLLAVYIPGLLGPQTVIGPALGAQTVGETPPITAAANVIDQPALGYPLAVRDDDTLVLPQLAPIPVGRMTLREVEAAIRKACNDAQILQEANARILVSLWRPREYRVLVVRQETAAETTTLPMLGMINQGHSKRGTGHVARLRAYENDVLHALMGSEIGIGGAGATGLPGLDAENAIYIIRRNHRRSACPAEEVDLRMNPGPSFAPAPQPQVQSRLPYAAEPPLAASQNQLPPQNRPQPYGNASEPLPPAAAPTTSPYATYRSAPQPPAPDAQGPPTAQPYTRTPYGTPENGMPILPQSYQVIRGQNYGRSLFGGPAASPLRQAQAEHIAADRGHSFASSVDDAYGSPTRNDAEYGASPAYYEQEAGARPTLEQTSASYGQGSWNGPDYGSAQPPRSPYQAGNGNYPAHYEQQAGERSYVQPTSTVFSQGSSNYRMPEMPQDQPQRDWSSMSRYAGMPSASAASSGLPPAAAPQGAPYHPNGIPESRAAMPRPVEADGWTAAPEPQRQAQTFAMPEVPMCPPNQRLDEGSMFPQEFGFEDFTIDAPDVIRIPVRLAPGESPNITCEDIKLYDGDIVFIESRESEVFYTGGLLGGGEYLLPRDRDLHVTEALSVAQARVTSSGTITGIGGVSALNGDVSVSPSRVIIRRRLLDGRTVPIEVDIYRARLHPEEDILIQPRDLILLEFTCPEATLAFIERHLLAGALFSVAAASLSTGSR